MLNLSVNGSQSALYGKSRKSAYQKMKRSWQLYVLILLPIAYIVIFAYYPMLETQIAFKDYSIRTGIWGGEWVGFKYFKLFISTPAFYRVMKNTVIISVYGLAAGSVLPIMLALSLNYVANERFKKIVQMISYAPNFISTVVICGMIIQFLNPRTGVASTLLQFVGLQPVDFLSSSSWFPSLYVWTGIWQEVGFGSIIYIAVLTTINPELHEAAIIDGSNKLQRMWHIDLPGLMPTAVVMLILNSGQILNLGSEKILLLQFPLNLRTSEVISTYVYKIGLVADIPNYSYATAIGLFQSVIGMVLLIAVNWLSKRFTENSLW